MPKQQVTDLITDQEMNFARLILAGTMTDRQAAEAAGLNPDTAAYSKAKPRVREYMLEQRAAEQEQLLQQKAEEQRRQNIGREKVLARLWEIANLSPEMTRNSINGQVRALSMIVAIEGLIPDRRATGKNSAEPLPGVNTIQPARPPVVNEKSAAKATANPARDSIESLFNPPMNPWEKAPSASYATIFASAQEPSVSFSMSGRPVDHHR